MHLSRSFSKRMDPSERGDAKALSDVNRIKMLLEMLRWPGPNPSLTSYMQIARPNPDGGKNVNEYKERPVLPDPLNLVPPGGDRSPHQFRPTPTRAQGKDKPSGSQKGQAHKRDDNGRGPNSRVRRDQEQHAPQPQVDKYFVDIKDILENEHPPNLSILTKKVEGKWPENQLKRLHLGKFKDAVEEANKTFNLGIVINKNDQSITYPRNDPSKKKLGRR